MNFLPSLGAAVLLSAVASCAQAARAQIPVEFGGAFSVPTTSLKEARFGFTLRQQYDFSCGSAAVATLLTHHYGHAVSEQQVFEFMYTHGDQQKIRTQGFSLLDMKSYLSQLGFAADGFVAPLEKLLSAKVPAIVLLKENGYLHFVVVKGLREGEVLIGDPAGGTRVIARARFDKAWVNHILFIIHNRMELAEFNSERDWRILPKAPLAVGLARGAFDLLPLRRGEMDF